MTTQIEENNDIAIALSYEKKLASLKERIADRLSTKCEATPSYMLEIDEVIHLSNSTRDHDMDDLRKILFGHVYEVTEKWDDNSSDYIYTQTVDLVKENLESLLNGEFQEEIEALAQELDSDSDGEDLMDELKEDDDFTASEIDFGGHYMKYDFRGEVAIYAATGISMSIAPGEDLFTALDKLRIMPADFLLACERHIAENGLTLEDAASLGLEDQGLEEQTIENEDNNENDIGPDEDENDVPEEIGSTLFALYRDEFEQQRSQCEMWLALAHVYTESPVVDADKLVKHLIDLGSDSYEIIAHGCGDNDMIENVSEVIAGSLDDPGTMHVQLRSGFLSTDITSDEQYGDVLPLLAPLSTPLSTWRISDENNTGGEVTLSDEEKNIFLLRKLLHSTAENKSPVIPDTHQIEMIRTRIQSIPPWLLDQARNEISHNGTGTSSGFFDVAKELIEEEMQRLQRADSQLCFSAIPNERTLQLQACLSAGNPNPDHRLEQVAWLIQHGADVNVKAQNGIAPAHQAAILMSEPLLRLLAEAGADMNVNAHDVSSEFAVTPLSQVAVGIRHGLNDGVAALDYLLSIGCVLPDKKIANFTPHYIYDPLSLAISKSLSLTVSVLATMRPKESSQHQLRINNAFYRSAVRLEIEKGLALLAAGADIDYQIRQPDGTMMGIAEAVDAQFAKNYGTSGDSQEHKKGSEFMKMIHATRAKQQMAAILEKAKKTTIAAP